MRITLIIAHSIMVVQNGISVFWVRSSLFSKGFIQLVRTQLTKAQFKCGWPPCKSPCGWPRRFHNSVTKTSKRQFRCLYRLLNASFDNCCDQFSMQPVNAPQEAVRLWWKWMLISFCEKKQNSYFLKFITESKKRWLFLKSWAKTDATNAEYVILVKSSWFHVTLMRWEATVSHEKC